MQRLGRLEAGLDLAISICTVTLTVAMALLIVVSVVLRYGFGAPLIYSYDLSTLIFAWIIFLGLYSAERDGAHLGLDLVDRLPAGRPRTAFFIIRQVALIALSAFMIWVGARLVMRTGMEIPSLRLSVKWLYASLPVGFILLIAIQLLRLLRLVFELRRA